MWLSVLWYPGKRDLTDKIDSVDVYVTTPPDQYAVGNGTLEGIEEVDGKWIHHWRHRHPIATTYLLELAITNYRTQSAFADAAILEVKLETGRRNQIRVQLAELGHPILGDPRYRADLATHRAWPYRRIALHAESLGFIHPVSQEPVRFLAPWPQEFRDFQRSATKSTNNKPNPPRKDASDS